MDIDASLALLGGLSPRQFMKRHWHKKPLLVRGAIAAVKPPLSRAQLFGLATRDEVESRLVVQTPPPQGGRKPAARAKGVGAQWALQRGPFARRSLPPVQQPHWTLLVQGVDLHDDAARDLLDRFRFVPDARLDDLMISYATDGGGVGPHFDSYDVFLLQVQGRRRWRIGRQKDLSLRFDSPAVDAGNLAWLPQDALDVDGDGILAELLPLDLQGTTRVLGPGIDMGAFERP